MRHIFCALLVSFSLYADLSIALIAKVIPNPSEGYFVFSDGTFWKVSSFIQRWRTPLEWLAGEELYLPDDYVCSVGDQSVADLFDPYLKEGSLRVNESDASNQVDLRRHSHLLVNRRTGKILFGSPVHPADFLCQLYEQGRNQGYDLGYSEGYSSGYHAGYAAGDYAAAERIRQP